jgi:hypothetical protein
MHVKTEKLLLVIGIVWLVAGINVFIIGVAAVQNWMLWYIFLGAFVIFCLFGSLILARVMKRYNDRVKAMTESTMPVWQAFDARGYLIIAVMMGGGIALRVSGVAPEWFIAFFYTGLGPALMFAGLHFFIFYLSRNRTMTGHHHCPQGQSPR